MPAKTDIYIIFYGWGVKNPVFLNELYSSIKGIGIQFGFRAPGYHSLGFDAWNWGGRTLNEISIIYNEGI